MTLQPPPDLRKAATRGAGVRRLNPTTRRLRLSMELLEHRHLLAGELNWFSSFESVPRVEASELAATTSADDLELVGPRERIASEWIVQLHESATRSLSSIASAAKLLQDPAVKFQIIGGLGSPGSLLIRGLGVEMIDVQQSLSRNVVIDSFSRNQLIEGQATAPNESDYAAGLLAGLQTIGASEAWDVDRGHSEIVVGVLDTGIDATHPDLYLNIWLNQGELPGILTDGEGTDLVDIDGDGLITFYDLNNVVVADAVAPHTLIFGGWDVGPNAAFVSDANRNGFIDAKDLLSDTTWADGRDNDGNGFFDDLFGVNFRAGTSDTLAPNDPSDLLGHGTHVAGTVGAIGNNGEGVVGVNWRTSLMSLRILDNNNQGDTGSALRAINYARRMRGDLLTDGEGRVVRGADVRVLNNSWGQPGGYESSVEQAINRLGEEEVLFVAAAGNGNILGQGVDNDRTPFYPASYDSPNVIAVAASTFDDALASFSNFGIESVDIAAPGVAVRSTLPGGRYGSANGTSMATPHVAGTAALIWSASPEATLAEVLQAIRNTAEPLAVPGGAIATGGRVDAAGAINSDVFAPAARLISAMPVTEAGGVTHEISVQYLHRTDIDVSTIGDDDLTVTRQWGPATEVGIALKSGSVVVDGDSVTATYLVTAPGGIWDALDYGGYVIATKAGAVATVTGAPTESREVGGFQVRIEDPSVLYVNRYDDAFEGNSLRNAINAANAAGASRTIILESGTYTIDREAVADPAIDFYVPPPYCSSNELEPDRWSGPETGDLDITGDITVVGNSMDDSIIDGQGFDRVFKVHEGAALTLRRLTVTGGVSPWHQGGGGVLTAGELTLEDTLVHGNRAVSNGQLDPSRGGGIAVWSGMTHLSRSWLARNESDFGGGIFFCDGANGHISRSTLEANDGGGLHSHSDNDIDVVNSTFSANSGGLGAIYNGKQDDFGNQLASSDGSIDDSGQMIAFVTEVVTGDYDGLVAVQDTQTQYVEFITRTPEGGFPDGASDAPVISGSGGHVVYESDATNLAPNDDNGFRDVFSFDRQTNQTELISRGTGGQSANGVSSDATVSPDGRFVAFVSEADNLVAGDTNEAADIFVYDQETGLLERVSVASDGTEADAFSSAPSLSDDGRYVAFSSLAENLVAGDSNHRADVFLFDRQTRNIERIGVGKSSITSDGDSLRPMISGDGSTVVFQTLAEDLLPTEIQIERAGGTAAASFDGTDDLVIVADAPELRAGQFSIELLAFVASTGIESGDPLLVKSTDDSWSDGYGLYYQAGHIYFFVSGQDNHVSAPVKLDRFQHLVGTYDGATIQLFVDGEVVATAPFTGPLVHSFNDLMIGGGPGSTQRFNGLLDEVAIFDSALAEAAVSRHAETLVLQRPAAGDDWESPLSPQDNDDFANARDLRNRVYYSDVFFNGGASSEYGEPMQSGKASSVWWSWTAPVDGRLTVGTNAAYRQDDLDTYVTIARGDSVDQLTVLAQDDNSGWRKNAVATTDVVEGETYSFSVDGYQSIEGYSDVDIDFVPANALVENSLDVGAVPMVAVPGYAAGGRFNVHHYDKASWWSWTAPADGVLFAGVENAQFEGHTSSSDEQGRHLEFQLFQGVPAFDGTYTGGLTQVATTANNGNTLFPHSLNTPVTAGEQYHVRVAHLGRTFFGTSFDLKLEFFDQTRDVGNDSFASAIDLGSVDQVSADGWNVGYDAETSEPRQSDEIASAWWTWTAPSNGMLTVDTTGSRFDTYVTFAAGASLDQLTIIDQYDENVTFGPDRIVVPVQAGIKYVIAVDGLEDQQGVIQLNLELNAINDNFVDRIDMGSEPSVEVFGTNLGFSVEPGEVEQDGAISSAWWSWTAPGDGYIRVDSKDGEIAPYLTIATGDAIENLTVRSQARQFSWSSPVVIPVLTGNEYQIAVDGSGFDDEGMYRLTLDFHERASPLGNDLFRDRIDLGAATTAALTGNNTGYVNDYGIDDASAWWSWTAPQDGVLVLEPDQTAAFDPVFLHLLTGSQPGALQQVARNFYATPTVMEPVTAGTQYQIAVGKQEFDGTGDFSVSLQMVPAHSNDDFNDRVDLGNAREVSVVGTNIDFTAESGETGQSGNINSAWWSWTAPADGTVYLSSSFDDHYITVGTGTAANMLAVLNEQPAQGASNAPRLPVAVVAGTEYQIRVDGKSNHTGAFRFDLEFFADNDDFADRVDLGSAPQIQTAGYIRADFSAEFQEPNQSGERQSAWWSWTAPANGAVEVQVSNSDASSGNFHFLTIATGSELSGLAVVAQDTAEFSSTYRNIAHATIAVSEGETYQIAVDLLDNQINNYSRPPLLLDIEFTPEVDNSDITNNAFEHRIDLGRALSTQIVGTNRGFTGQSNEPLQSGEIHSAWYSWTAIADGQVMIKNDGDLPVHVTVATGEALQELGNLRRMAIDPQQSFSHTVEVNQSYAIAIDGLGIEQGDFELGLTVEVGPGGTPSPNLSAQILSDQPVGFWSFDTAIAATIEDRSGNGLVGISGGDLENHVPGLNSTDVQPVVSTVYRYDRLTGDMDYVSLTRAGLTGPTDNVSPVISRDGRYLAFASNVASADGVYVLDWNTESLSLATTGQFIPEGGPLAITSDGRYVTLPTNIFDTTNQTDVSPFVTAQSSLSMVRVLRSTIAHTQDAERAVGGEVLLHDVLLSHNFDGDFDNGVGRTNVVDSFAIGADLIGELIRFDEGVPVHPILRGNPALDSGDTALDIQIDQRGELRVDPDIGAFEATTGAIRGRLFLDLNGNQVFDREERGIPGARLVATGIDGGHFSLAEDDNVLTPQLDESGRFLLKDLKAGSYLVNLSDFPNWTVLRPDFAAFPVQTLQPSSPFGNTTISKSGRFIAFDTTANNLLPEDSDGDRDVYLYDRVSSTLERVTDQTDGVLLGISDDGQTILYGSAIDSFFQLPYRFHVYDRTTGQHDSVYSNGGVIFDANASLTSDGRYAIFSKSSSGSPYVREIRAGTEFQLSSVVPAGYFNVRLEGYVATGPELIYAGTYRNAQDEYVYTINSYNITTESTQTLYSELGNYGDVSFVNSISRDGDQMRFQPPSSSIPLLLVRSEGTIVADSFTSESSTGYPDNGVRTSLDGRFIVEVENAYNFETRAYDSTLIIKDRSSGDVENFDLTAVRSNGSGVDASISDDGHWIAAGRVLVPNPFQPGIGVQIEQGDLLTDFNIGLVPNPGTISGNIFEDIASNSVRDAGEPGVEGWRVFLDANQNGVLDTGERSATTDARGDFQFEEVDSFQEYSLRLEVGEGFTQVLPDSPHGFAWDIFLPAGGEITGRDFAVRRVVNTPQSTHSSVAGRIFDDVNGNESFDVGVDRPHRDVRVFLDANNDRQHNPGTNEPITRTDADGRYLFAGLGSRIVSVSTILDGGTVHASPLGNSYSQATYPMFPGLQPFGNPQAIGIGDFNGDGYGDAAVLLGERNQIAIRLNNGRGGFDAGGFAIDLGSVGAGPVAMVVGQFNGDGTPLDIAVASQFASNAVIVLDVDAAFGVVGSQTAVAVGAEPTDITAADVNGDGTLDLVLTNKGFPGEGSISVLLNQGNGAFTAGAPIRSAGRFPVSVVVGEFTGDGHLDVAVAHASPSLPTTPHGDVRVLAGDSSGNFSYDGNRYEVGALPTDLLTSDFDGDGLADLAVANFASNTISLLSGAFQNGSNGPTVFRTEAAILGTASGAIDIAIGDMDGDGDADILASNLLDRNISIFRNVSTPLENRFEPLENIGLGQFTFAQRMPLATANIDGDVGGVGGQGTLDIITVPRLTDTIHVLKNELIDGSHRVRLDGLNDVVGLDFRTRPAVVAPTLDPIPDLPPVDEDDGAINLTLSGISKGRGDGPDLQLTAISSHPGVIPHPLIAYAPEATWGSLSLIPNENANTADSPVTVTVEARNAGANGVFGDSDDGVVRQSFTVTVQPVNDPPDFELQPLVSVTQKMGSLSIDGFASGLSPGGGTDEAAQILSAFGLQVSNPSLFSVMPKIDAQGRLTFTPDPNRFGVTLIHVSVSDNGGQGLGGADTTTKSFVINVGAVNDPPSIILGADLTVDVGGGPQMKTGFANNFHPGSGSDDDAQLLSDFVVSTNRADLFLVLPDIDNDGTLTFTPSDSNAGSAIVTVQARDDGGRASGGEDLSAPKTFNITVSPGGTPEVESVVINEGSAARSQVTSLTVNFSEKVDHALLAEAFTLTNSDTGLTVGSIGVQAGDVGGKTSAILTFSGTSTVMRGVGVSLSDGNYRLEIVAEKVTASVGGSAMADDYQFGGHRKSEPNNDDFFRLYGDFDGDGDVDGKDYARFGTTFLSQSGDPTYNVDLDYDGDADIDGLDHGQFRKRFFESRN